MAGCFRAAGGVNIVLPDRASCDWDTENRLDLCSFVVVFHPLHDGVSLREEAGVKILLGNVVASPLSGGGVNKPVGNIDGYGVGIAH